MDNSMGSSEVTGTDNASEGNSLIPRRFYKIDNLLKQEIDGCCLIPTETNNAEVLDYLFDCVFKYNKSIGDMFMEDGCCLTENDMRYFDKRFFGKIPSYRYWKMWLKSLPKEVQEDIEITERELLKTRYVREMQSMAELGMVAGNESKLFGYWHKLHAIADREQDRIEKRQEKRAARAEMAVDKGVSAAAKMLKALSDENLIELKVKVQELVDKRNNT